MLWQGGKIKDIVAPGFGALNSLTFGINEKGQVGIQAETSTKDPNNENFCVYGTGLKCRAFLWQNGVITLLPTLGGNNTTIGQMNNQGEIPGVAETSNRDPQCPPEVQPAVPDLKFSIMKQ